MKTLTAVPSYCNGTKQTARPRWPEHRVLTEARKKTQSMSPDMSVQLQQELATMLVTAGWSEEEFIDALCKDVIKSNTKK